jgi:hypothetical protein
MYDYQVWTLDGRSFFAVVYWNREIQKSVGPFTGHSHDPRGDAFARADRFGWTWLKGITRGRPCAQKLLIGSTAPQRPAVLRIAPLRRAPLRNATQ